MTITDIVHKWRGDWNKALNDFWNILRQLGLKYLPAIFTVYKRTSSYYLFFLDNNEDKSKL